MCYVYGGACFSLKNDYKLAKSFKGRNSIQDKTGSAGPQTDEIQIVPSVIFLHCETWGGFLKGDYYMR